MRTRLSAFFLSCCFPLFAHAQAGGSVVFVGTEVLPLGNATLSTGPALVSSAAPLVNNRLYVGNLSFSGSDGFSMQIGGGSGALISFKDTAPTFPVGGEMEFRVSNSAGFVPCIRIVMSDALTLETNPEFGPVGDYSFRVEVWNDGVPVAGFDGVSGSLTAPMFPVAFAIDLESVIAPLPELPLPARSAFALSDGFVLRWGTAVTHTDDAGNTLGTGDELRIYPEGAVPLGSVNSIDVTVAIPPTLPPYTMIVDDLAQQQFGRLHRGGGSATIRCHTGVPTGLSATDVFANHREISFTNLPGLSGSLRVDLHPSQSGDDLIWDLKDGFVAGDMDEFSVTAELLTGGQAVVGKVTSLHTGSHWNVTPDFSGSGSPDARVELFDALGNLVVTEPHVTGFTVMTDEWAVQTGVEDEDDLALIMGFASSVAIDIPGCGVATANIIKMHSNGSKRHKFFAIVDRSAFRVTGTQFFATGERPELKLAQNPGIVDYASTGSAYGKKGYDSLLLNNMGTTGSDGVEIEPCWLPGETPPNQFGVEWMPLGPPSANMGQTDWDFLTRHAGQPGPIQAMSIHMESNGSMVGVMTNPGPSQTPAFRVVLKSRGRVVAEFVHTDFVTAFAELPDWPIAVGYQLLAYDDQPWSMWIGLGYEMDVTIPGLATPRNGAAAMPLVKADLIEVIAQNMINPGPPDATVLAGKFAGIPFIVLRDDRPTATQVGATTPFVRSVLRPAYPNPFNPQTTLSFDLATSGPVSLKIYAVDGSYVATLHAGTLSAGTHAYPWNGVDHRGQTAASGVYFAELRTPDGAQRTKLNLLK